MLELAADVLEVLLANTSLGLPLQLLQVPQLRLALGVHLDELLLHVLHLLVHF